MKHKTRSQLDEVRVLGCRVASMILLTGAGYSACEEEFEGGVALEPVVVVFFGVEVLRSVKIVVVIFYRLREGRFWRSIFSAEADITLWLGVGDRT